MVTDPRPRRMGEDLGRSGAFGRDIGVCEAFAPNRVSDVPISEPAIVAATFGAAMVGTHPVVKMRFADFALH